MLEHSPDVPQSSDGLYEQMTPHRLRTLAEQKIAQLGTDAHLFLTIPSRAKRGRSDYRRLSEPGSPTGRIVGVVGGRDFVDVPAAAVIRWLDKYEYANA